MKLIVLSCPFLFLGICLSPFSKALSQEVTMMGLEGGAISSDKIYEFSAIEVKGNDLLEAASVTSIARVEANRPYSASELDDAVQRLNRTGLFEDISLLPVGDKLVISFTELPIISAISFEGNDRIKDASLAGVVISEIRKPYSAANAEADAKTIADLYRAKGRINAIVTPKIIRRDVGRVDLVFEIVEGSLVEIERVSFIGNSAFSDWRLQRVVETKQAGFLRFFLQSDVLLSERFELDKELLSDFYLSRGYIDFDVTDVSAEVARARDAVFVTYTIREGKRFRVGEVTTISKIDGLDPDSYAKIQKLRSGNIYSAKRIDSDIIRMENLALRNGIRFFAVEPRISRNDSMNTVDIEFVIMRSDRLFVERINVQGNTTTLDSVVRREFRFAEGDPFSAREIRLATERIRALGFFGDVQVDAVLGSSDEEVVVDVDVEEQPTGSLSFGVSYSFDTGIGYAIGFSEQNFLGRGQQLGLQFSGGIRNTDTSLDFYDPAILGRDISFLFSAFYSTSRDKNVLYDTDIIGSTFGLGFPVGELGALELDYTIARKRMKNYNGRDVGGVVVRSPIIAEEVSRGAEIVSAPGYNYVYDSRIGGLDPDLGFLMDFSQSFAGFGGSAKYIRSELRLLGERNVWNEELLLRAVFEFGALNSYGGYVTRSIDRFFGAGKIRGFEAAGLGPRDSLQSGGVGTDDALGGNYYQALRLETEFPLGLPSEYNLRGGAFWDFGSVWGLDYSDGVDDSFHLRSVIGVSLLWGSPIGPLRFDFSKAIRKEPYDKERNFDFSIATSF